MDGREKEKAFRESEILDAAERLFCGSSFEAVGVDEIAAASGYTKRTLYRYFPSKEELLFASAARSMELLMSGFDSALCEEKNPLLSIRKAGMVYFDFFEHYRSKFRLVMKARRISRPESESGFHKKILDLEGRLFQAFAKAIGSGISAGLVDPSLKPYQGAVFLISTTISLLEQLDAMDEQSLSVLGWTSRTFYEFSLDRMIRSIRK